jgi:hypothetical protein
MTAQGIQAVALAGPHVFRHLQCVDNTGAGMLYISPVYPAQFSIKEADIEWGIMDNQFSAINKIKEVVDNIGKCRFVLQEFK